jgi:uncharacterized protein YyaL (SSP411 family)
MNLRNACALVAFLFLLHPALGEVKGKPNRLAKEASPYLRQHAHNPVDWYPWGEEAFKKAKAEKKLVFLSIGYSACHWCHVMEKESFSNAVIAKILNDNFVCIKVDREERPDIDHAYLTSLNVLGQRGGWPLSMFLLPDAKPFFGGTYWPAFDKEVQGQNMRGFKSVLEGILNVYKTEQKNVEEQAEKLATSTRRVLLGETVGLALIPLDKSLVNASVEAVQEGFDPKYGGFGSQARNFQGPKFPTPCYLKLLQREQGNDTTGNIKSIVSFTLDQMALGGIFDHLGGGFHRYTVEPSWTIPHFEKMLYDNAQLCEAYSRALFNNKNPLYEQALNSTCAFILREMTSPEGGFYSALDADSDGEEGKFYVWTDKELAEVLKEKPDLELFKTTYASVPNFEEKFFILRRSMLPEKLALSQKTSLEKLEGSLDASRKKLLALRNNRIRPFLDTKILTGWNGQMIAGLAMASKALNEPSYLKAAEKASDFILNNLQQADGRLMRSFGAVPGEKAQAKILAYLDDYAYLIHGLLTLYEINGDKKRLAQAVELNEKMIKHHGKEGTGPFFQTSEEHEKLFARSIDQYDGAQPSANSIALSNMVKLSKYTQDTKHIKVAEDSFKGLVMRLKMQPSSSTALATALAEFLEAQPKK